MVEIIIIMIMIRIIMMIKGAIIDNFPKISQEIITITTAMVVIIILVITIII